MSGEDRRVSARRTLQQAIHCLEEAKSVVENGEDARCAQDDVWQAGELIRVKIVSDIAQLVREQEGVEA